MDAAYLVSVVGGLYGQIDPERAMRIMRRELKTLSQEEQPVEKVT